MPRHGGHLDSFYVSQEGLFVPGLMTVGPWDARFQHGGPPSALLGRALEGWGESQEWLLGRVTVELLRPVPLVPLRVEVEPVRVGRQAQWLESRLYDGDRLLALARGVRVRRRAHTLAQPNAAPEPPPPGPEGLPVFDFPFFVSEPAYHRAVELRMAEGTWGRGPATVWMRLRFPLVAGAENSPWVHVLGLVDAANGVAPALDIRRFSFVNPDLTVHLQRPPAGTWIGLEARSVPGTGGLGLVQAKLFDVQGEIGRCLQTLLIAERD